MTVRVQQLNKNKRGKMAVCPKLPKPKEEGWWILLGSEADDELLGLKRINIRRHITTTNLSFLCPESAGQHSLVVYVVSDSYLGLDGTSAVDVQLYPC
mmetsp:Transcript_49334/g.77070  ORF Transcript_49334/g.77070 Transcript_49334/m.77070 type:complete len:98 (-) Transcript_49334:39-332(-)